MNRRLTRGSATRAVPTLVAIAVAVSLAATSASAKEDLTRRGGETSPPAERADRYLRTPLATSDLTFSLRDRPGWILSGVTFGIREGRLVMASFLAEAPDGTVSFVDESEFVEAIVADTTKLPRPVFRTEGKKRYQLLGFTLSRGPGNQGYVDWTHEIDELGAPRVTTVQTPSPDLEPDLPLCRLTPPMAQCLNLCFGGECVDIPGDPCVCSLGTGGCIIDFWYPSECLAANCPGECVFVSGRCGCFMEGCI